MAKRDVVEIPLPSAPPPDLAGFDLQDWEAVLAAAQDNGHAQRLDAEAVAVAAQCRAKMRYWQRLVSLLPAAPPDLPQAARNFWNCHQKEEASRAAYLAALAQLLLVPRSRSSSRTNVGDQTAGAGGKQTPQSGSTGDPLGDIENEFSR